eukprot:gene12134-25466_t
MDDVDFVAIGQSLQDRDASPPDPVPVVPLWDQPVFDLIDSHLLSRKKIIKQPPLASVSQPQAKILSFAERFDECELPASIASTIDITELSKIRKLFIAIPGGFPSEPTGLDVTFLTTVNWWVAEVLERPSSGSGGHLIVKLIENCGVGVDDGIFEISTCLFMSPAP